MLSFCTFLVQLTFQPKQIKMKPNNFLVVLCATFSALLVTSCGGNTEKTEAKTSDSTSTNVTTNTVTSNIVSTPEYMMNVRHKVADYAKWKPVYDSHDSACLASGIHNYVVARGTKDSNMVMVAFKIDDVTKAKAFAKAPSLKQAMQRGGVTGTPIIAFDEMVYQDTTTLPANITRTLITFKVKDWEAWRKAFETDRKLRSDNGVTDRVYGHDASDSNKVVLVVAINDSAKADAFWKSDVLKQKRAESGVISQPEMFSFRVVQRY
jgi:hypothetical protein